MTAKRPTFRVMKNGYDRFAVDDAVEKYAAQVDDLEKRIVLYQQQLTEYQDRISALERKCQDMSSSIEAKQAQADDIARLSLREANDIISNAKRNADQLIHEAIETSQMILKNLDELSNQAKAVKKDMYHELDDLKDQLDHFEVPDLPDTRWLDEADKRMR